VRRFNCYRNGLFRQSFHEIFNGIFHVNERGNPCVSNSCAKTLCTCATTNPMFTTGIRVVLIGTDTCTIFVKQECIVHPEKQIQRGGLRRYHHGQRCKKCMQNSQATHAAKIQRIAIYELLFRESHQVTCINEMEQPQWLQSRWMPNKSRTCLGFWPEPKRLSSPNWLPPEVHRHHHNHQPNDDEVASPQCRQLPLRAYRRWEHQDCMCPIYLIVYTPQKLGRKTGCGRACTTHAGVSCYDFRWNLKGFLWNRQTSKKMVSTPHMPLSWVCHGNDV